MNFMQTFYIRILRPFSISENRSVFLRNSIILICFVIIFFDVIIGYINPLLIEDNSSTINAILMTINGIGDRGRAIVGLVSLIIIILASTGNNLSKIKWKWYILVLWYLIGILVVITGAFHDIGSGLLITEFTITLLFPVLYFVWQNRNDIETLFDLMTIAVLLVTIVFGIISVITIPFVNQEAIPSRYEALTRNPNILGFCTVTSIIASLYLVYRQKRIWTFISSIVLGMSVAFLVLSLARSATLAVIISSTAWLILYIRNKKSTRLLITVVLIAAIAFFSFYFITTRGTDPAGITSQVTNSVVYATDDSNQKQTTTDFFERLKNFTNLDQYSSGRLDIWKLYFEGLNYSGNDVSYSLPIRVVSYNGYDTRYYYYAHNTALEFAYRSGIPSGILYVILCVIVLFYGIKKVFNFKYHLKDHECLTVMIIFSFLVIGLVESLEFTFSRDVAVLFYFALVPLFKVNHDKVDVGDQL